jgi:hypothetical protein
MARTLAVGALVGLALTAGGASGSTTAGAGCPRSALPLTGTNLIGPAAAAALHRVPASDRPQVRGAALAIADNLRRPPVKTQCGQRAARTIVVYILRRALLPAQSASQGVYFVSRFPNGYRVWQVAP